MRHLGLHDDELFADIIRQVTAQQLARSPVGSGPICGVVVPRAAPEVHIVSMTGNVGTDITVQHHADDVRVSRLIAFRDRTRWLTHPEDAATGMSSYVGVVKVNRSGRCEDDRPTSGTTDISCPRRM
jgi:hypothetical protein